MQWDPKPKRQGLGIGFVKRVGILSAVSLLSRGLGLLRDGILTAYLGTSTVADLFILATSIPNMFATTVGSVITNALIPGLTTDDSEHRNIRTLSSWVFLVAVLLATLVGLSAGPMARLMAPDADDSSKRQLTELITLTSPAILFYFVAAVGTAFHQARDSFTIPAMAAMTSNMGFVLGALLLAAPFGVRGVAIAFLLGSLAQCLGHIWRFARLGYRLEGPWLARSPVVSESCRLLGPMLLSSGLGQVASLVHRALAVGLSAGSAAALTYAFRTDALAVGLLSAPLITVMYPRLAAAFASGDRALFTQDVRKSLWGVGITMLPITILLVVLRQPIVRVLYQRGQFGPDATSLTAQALLYYGIGLVAMAERDVLARAVMAARGTRLVSMVGVVGFVSYIGFGWGLMKVMGIGGLALGASFSALLEAFLLYLGMFGSALVALPKEKNLMVRRWVTVTAAGIVSLVATLAVSSLYGTGQHSVWRDLILIVLCSATGLLSFGFVLFLGGFDEVRVAVNRFLRIRSLQD